MANLCPWKREVNSGIVTGGKDACKYLAIWRERGGITSNRFSGQFSFDWVGFCVESSQPV